MKAIYVDGRSGGRAEVRRLTAKVYLLATVEVPPEARGKGVASRLLKRVMEDADAEGVALQLHASSRGGLTQDALVSWYERHGFECKMANALLYHRPPK